MQVEKLRILLVEDNDDHAELVARSLEQHRIPNKMYRINDGEAAIEYLMHTGKYSDISLNPLPHLILLDLRLPKVDGLNVLKYIKNHHGLKKIPVVILTSSESVNDIQGSYSNYANSYLVKPIDYNKFKKMMDDIGIYWFNWNKNPSLTI
ncbi:MAG: response regulator [Bacteroidota bacterium]